ncbi:MAG TPA: gluconate 2-dehydrogenase subunit 3 family protein [Bryobacteraceae bacterium]
MNRRDLLKTIVAIPIAAIAQSPLAFFTPHQSQTMTDFADLIIPSTDTPGAREAHVTQYLDKLLAASDPGFQSGFSADLEALDRYAKQAGGAEFIRLTPDSQKSVLEKMSSSDQQVSFNNLKAWVARIYYATKPGFDELNKGGRVPASFACGA